MSVVHVSYHTYLLFAICLVFEKLYIFFVPILSSQKSKSKMSKIPVLVVSINKFGLLIFNCQPPTTSPQMYLNVDLYLHSTYYLLMTKGCLSEDIIFL